MRYEFCRAVFQKLAKPNQICGTVHLAQWSRLVESLAAHLSWDNHLKKEKFLKIPPTHPEMNISTTVQVFI
jgi:hypothetical protein